MPLEVTYISEANKQHQRGKEMGRRERRVASKWLQMLLLLTVLLCEQVPYI